MVGSTNASQVMNGIAFFVIRVSYYLQRAMVFLCIVIIILFDFSTFCCCDLSFS